MSFGFRPRPDIFCDMQDIFDALIERVLTPCGGPKRTSSKQHQSTIIVVGPTSNKESVVWFWVAIEERNGLGRGVWACIDTGN